MTTTNFRGLDDFAKRGPSMIANEIEELGLEFHKALHKEMIDDLIEATPIASPPDPRRAPGLMKMSWRTLVGGVQKGLIGLKPGEQSKIVNVSPHAIIVDKGRTRSKPKTGKRRLTPTKQIGSKQAPRGVVNPVLDTLEVKSDQIRAKVIRRAE